MSHTTAFDVLPLATAFLFLSNRCASCRNSLGNLSSVQCYRLFAIRHFEEVKYCLETSIFGESAALTNSQLSTRVLH